MIKLNVNRVDVILSAVENQNKKKYTLTGKFNSGNFYFKLLNDPNKPAYDGKAIKVIESNSTRPSPATFSHAGRPNDIWVWTESDNYAQIEDDGLVVQVLDSTEV